VPAERTSAIGFPCPSARVELRTESTPGATERLVLLSSDSTGGVLMGADDGTIDEVGGPVQHALSVRVA
jgi:hypothetical protein